MKRTAGALGLLPPTLQEARIADHIHARSTHLRARQGQGRGGAGGQARRRRTRDVHVQPAPAALRLGLRALPHDEGQPLGARGRPDGQGHRAVARCARPVRDRPLDRAHGHRLLLRRRGDRRRQRHRRRARARHGVRAQARARPPRARGEHPRRLAAVHDRQPRDRPARVRGDVRGHPVDPGQERVRHRGLARAAARPRHDRPGGAAAARAQRLRLRPVHGGHAVLRPVRDDPVALPPGQAARDRDDVPLHAAGRVQPHRALPPPAARARGREPGDLDAGLQGRAARADARGRHARAGLHRRLPAGRGRRPQRRRLRHLHRLRRRPAAGLASASTRCATSRSRTRCRGWRS